MTYPPHEPPPPTDPPPQPPYVPGYGTPPGQAPETPGFGQTPETYGYGQTPGYGQPTETYGYGQAPGYGQPPQPYGYGPPPPYYPMYPYGYLPQRETEGLAIASLVVSCAAVLAACTWGIGGVLGIVGAILGHVARGRLRHNGKSGSGMALAGVIVGWSLAALSAVLAVVLVVLITHDNSTQST